MKNDLKMTLGALLGAALITLGVGFYISGMGPSEEKTSSPQNSQPVNMGDLPTNVGGPSVLAPVQGGTGTSTVPSAGELLIGNGTTGKYEVSTLTAGSDINITNADGSITIGSTVSGSGSTFAWTPDTTYGETANSTTTPIWLKDTLYASSTVYLSDTTVGQLTVNDGTVVGDRGTIGFGSGDFELTPTAGNDIELQEPGGSTRLRVLTDGSGVEIVNGDFSVDNLTADQIVATDGSKNLVSTSTIGNNFLSSDVSLLGQSIDTTEIEFDPIEETELDSESELEGQLTGVTDVFTNNDGALTDDDLSDDNTDDLSEGSTNLYYTDTRVADYVNSSTTIATYPDFDTESEFESRLFNVVVPSENNDTEDDLSNDNISALSNVDDTGVSNWDILTWNGTNWVDTSTSTYMTEGENISLLNNDSGYITDANDTVDGSELDNLFSSNGFLKRTGANTYTSDAVIDFSDETNATAGTGISFSEDSVVNDLGNSIETGEITDGTIAEADLDIANSATDEYSLTYESDTGNFQWADVAGGGVSNLEDLGDVDTTGEAELDIFAFNGTNWIATSTISDAVIPADYMQEGENISLLNNDSGYITSADDAVDGSELDNLFSSNGFLKRTGADTYTADAVVDFSDETNATAGTAIGFSDDQINYNGAISDNSDVDTTGAASSNLLMYNGSNWIAQATSTEMLQDEVTLAGTPDYLTISGQTITRNTVDFSDDTNATAGTGITFTDDDISLTNDFGSAISEDELASTDFGDFTCDGTDQGCTFDSSTVQDNEIDYSAVTLSDFTIDSAVYDFGGVTSFEIPNGASPTIDAEGEIAHDTTDDQLILGADADVIRTEDKIFAFAIASTSASWSGTKGLPPEKDGYTVTHIECYVEGGTSKQITITDGTNDMDTITCGTSVTDDDGSIANNTVTASEKMQVDLGATSGAVNWVNVSIFGKYTRE
jgi:hypothetical protein